MIISVLKIGIGLTLMLTSGGVFIAYFMGFPLKPPLVILSGIGISATIGALLFVTILKNAV